MKARESRATCSSSWLCDLVPTWTSPTSLRHMGFFLWARFRLVDRIQPLRPHLDLEAKGDNSLAPPGDLSDTGCLMPLSASFWK